MPYQITTPGDRPLTVSAVALNLIMFKLSLTSDEPLFATLDNGGTLDRQTLRMIAAVLPQDTEHPNISKELVDRIHDALAQNVELELVYEFGIAGIKASSDFISNSYR